MTEFNHNMITHPETIANLSEIHRLDPEIIDYSDETKKLIELGLESLNQVTERFGTTQKPKWASGTYEDSVIMSYHNGGTDGHTSIGSLGVGVPRNVLVIAKAVNNAAYTEVYSPLDRAIAFNAAAAHDIIQLCGRSLLPEGRVDSSRGDERMSAEYARDTYLASSGDSDIAQSIYNGVMATAFDPNTGSQNVYGREHYSTDIEYMRGALGQELVAAADLYGPTTSRGPLGALEYCVELLSTTQKNRITLERLASKGIDTSAISAVEDMLAFIDGDVVLRNELSSILTGQSKFFKEFISYTDTTIKLVSGKTIDELFPGRLRNGDILQGFSEDMIAGKTAMELWEQARIIAS